MWLLERSTPDPEVPLRWISTALLDQYGAARAGGVGGYWSAPMAPVNGCPSMSV